MIFSELIFYLFENVEKINICGYNFAKFSTRKQSVLKVIYIQALTHTHTHTHTHTCTYPPTHLHISTSTVDSLLVLDGELDDDRLSFIGKLVKGSGDSIELGILCRLDT